MAWRRLIKGLDQIWKHLSLQLQMKTYFTFMKNIRSTGKCSIVDISYSEDGLTKSKTRVFDSESSRNEYVADPVIQDLGKRHAAHCLSNNTVKSKVEDKEI